MASRERRTSVRDRIRNIEALEKTKGGNSTLLKTFDSQQKEDETLLTTAMTPAAVLNEAAGLDTSTTTTIDNSTAAVLEKTEETTTEETTEDIITSVKDRVHRLTVADICAQSEQKKQSYVKIRQSAKCEIAKLQKNIEQNSDLLNDITQQKSPEDRSPELITQVDHIRAELGEKRNEIRQQLTRQVLSARERIQSLLQEQKALHEAWEEYTAE